MSALEDFQSRGSATHTLVIRRAPRCLRASTRPVSRCHKGKSCGIFPRSVQVGPLVIRCLARNQ